MSLGVVPFTEKPSGGSRVYLDSLGIVSGLQFSTSYPGGDKSVELSLSAPPSFQSDGLRNGSMLYLYRGTSKIWSGRISSVGRGNPWKIQADGLGALAAQINASVKGNVNVVIDDAITNGLPWTRPLSVSTARTWNAGWGSADVAKISIDEVLTKLLASEGKRWKVSSGGVLSSVSDPTTPSFFMKASSPLPLVLNDYGTAVLARYQNTTGNFNTIRRKNQSAIDKFGYVEKQVDFGWLVLDSTTAGQYADNFLNFISPRLVVGGEFEIGEGQLFTANAGAVDLASFRAGEMIRIQLDSTMRDAFISSQTAVDVIVGETTYYPDKKTMRIAPVGFVKSDFQRFLGQRNWWI